MLVLFLLSVISHNALNLYGAVLSLITLVQTFAYRWIPTAKIRAVLSVIVLAACCFAAVGASANFIGHFVDMVLVLLVVLVPWTAINLIDFYAIHKGQYDINSIFKVDGGIYGRYNAAGVVGVCDRDCGADSVYEHAAVCRPHLRTHQWRGPVLVGRPADHLPAVLLASQPRHRLQASPVVRQTGHQSVIGTQSPVGASLLAMRP
jgi:hypothetical protein